MASRNTRVEIGGIEVTLSPVRDRPLILLLRMASGGMGIWDAIWADLARHFTLARFELAGLPAARDLSDPAGVFRALGRTAAEVASGLGRERFHLFGWNGGTLIALACAMDHPERVDSCILLDPFFPLADMRHVERAIEVKRVLLEHPDRSVYAFYWVMAGLIARDFDAVERLVAQRLARDAFVRADPERFMRWVRALRFTRFEDAELARIRAPTLILATAQDRWNAGPSIAMAREVQARLPRSELQVVENAGGLFLIEDPKRFLGLVEPFINRVVGAR